MEMYSLLEGQTSMRVEWKSVLIVSGGQCVMTAGTPLMLLWSAGSWDMLTLEVSFHYNHCGFLDL